jgi:hypothetical protein
MGKPNYRVVISYDRDRSVHCARAPELEHLSGEGPSRAAAIAALEVEIDAQLANMLSHGTTPPLAVDETEYSGEIQAKVSRTLHRDLCLLARSDGLPLDQVVGELLAAAITARQGARGGTRSRAPQHEPQDDIGNRIDGNRGDGNRRGMSRGQFNNQIMDDRANFIEYVRGLEQGQPGNGRAHGGHGGGHGGYGGHGNNQGGGRRRRGRGGPPGHGGQGGQQGGRDRDGNRMHNQGGSRPHQGVNPGNQAPRPTPAGPPPPSTAGSEPQES